MLNKQALLILTFVLLVCFHKSINALSYSLEIQIDNLNYSGCTDPWACNYDPNATEDNESCDYSSCYNCNSVDLDDNNQINASDLLIWLSFFGSEEESVDLDNDGIITIREVLVYKIFEGQTCD